MKKFSYLLLIPILFLAGCSFTFDTSIPEDNPPTIDMSNWVEADLEEKEELQDNNEAAGISDAAMLNVVVPSEERETQRLLEEYQATLEAINESIE